MNKTKLEREAGFCGFLTGDKFYNNLYSEVLKAIVSIEKGIAREMELSSRQKQRIITREELDEIVTNLESNSNLKPFIEETQNKMGWINLPFNEALNKKSEAHYKFVTETDFNKFIAAKNRSLKKNYQNQKLLLFFKD